MLHNPPKTENVGRIIRSCAGGALLLLLAACGGSSSPPPPPPPPPASPWAITQGSTPQPLQVTNGVSYFDFPVCAPSVCHVSYVEEAWGSPLTGKSSITASYSIYGDAPVFDAHVSADNTCEPNVPHVLLILQQAGDNLSGAGVFAFYRWFSMADEQPLALGDHTLTVPLSEERWTPVYPGQAGQDAGWAGALANMGKIGFGFGGGCFAAHGVSVTSGSARFVIHGLSVN